MSRSKSNGTAPANDSSANLGFEAKLWLAADKLHLAPGELSAERDSFGETAPVGCSREAMHRLNLFPIPSRCYSELLSVELSGAGAGETIYA